MIKSPATRRHFLQATGLSAAAVSLGSLLPPRRAVAQRALAENESPKGTITLGLASYTLRKFDLDETLAMTRRVGLDTICLKSFHLPMNSSPEQIADVAARVKAAGIRLYGGGVISMRDEGAARQAFEYAKAAGMKTIVGAPNPAILPLVDKLVKEYDIEVAIHNHGPGDNTYPTPQSIVAKVKDLDPRIGICMDIGHTLRAGADPILDARRYADRLLDVHIKDVSGGVSAKTTSPAGRAVEVGRGVIDIPRFLQTLIATGYSGTGTRGVGKRGIVSFEYEKDASDPLAGLAESVGYVRGVLAVLGRARPEDTVSEDTVSEKAGLAGTIR